MINDDQNNYALGTFGAFFLEPGTSGTTIETLAGKAGVGTGGDIQAMLLELAKNLAGGTQVKDAELAETVVRCYGHYLQRFRPVTEGDCQHAAALVAKVEGRFAPLKEQPIEQALRRMLVPLLLRLHRELRAIAGKDSAYVSAVHADARGLGWTAEGPGRSIEAALRGRRVL